MAKLTPQISECITYWCWSCLYSLFGYSSLCQGSITSGSSGGRFEMKRQEPHSTGSYLHFPEAMYLAGWKQSVCHCTEEEYCCHCNNPKVSGTSFWVKTYYCRPAWKLAFRNALLLQHSDNARRHSVYESK